MGLACISYTFLIVNKEVIELLKTCISPQGKEDKKELRKNPLPDGS